MADLMDRVVPLENLEDFKVAEGDPDVRGWDVVLGDGTRIGEVDRLLVDPHAMKVRYLDVDLDNGLLDDGDERHVLVPIGSARLDRDDDRVLVDGLTRVEVRTLPEYRHAQLTHEDELLVRRQWDRGYTGVGSDPDFYNHRLYDDHSFYGPRRVNTERQY